ARDVGEGARLIGRDVAERQGHRRDGVPRLLLRVRVRTPPLFEAGRVRSRGQLARRMQRSFVELVEIVEERRPARIRPALCPFFADEPLEFVDAELLHQELDARARTILFLTESTEYARDGLRHRKELGLREELVDELRGVRHRAEPPADVELEPADGLTVDDL